jgi:hypothetical protein
VDENGKLERPDVRLTETEETVLRELAQREHGAVAPRLARSYRRLLELSRSDDAVDAVLVAHLVREILSALPGAFGIELPREHLEYENRIQDLSRAWPADARAADPPRKVIQGIRHLLEEHDRASSRARRGPRALFEQEDRAHAGFVPDPAIDRWVELSRRGSDLAHGIAAIERELPSSEEARRLVDELTATLIAAIAPYFVGIGEVDRLLALESPSDDDARRVAALLRTASQFAYFFERADPRWLRPLAGVRRLMTTPPGLIDVGGGYARAPDWPQGRFLARVAGGDPQFVAELVERVPPTSNPRVVALISEIARALPGDLAARLVPHICRRMPIPLAVEYAAIEAATLAGELGHAGHGEAGAQLLTAVFEAALASPRDDAWHLEQILGDPVEAVVRAGGELGRPLTTCLRRLLRGIGPSRRYSTIWLPNIDRRPPHGVEARWLIPNALYRVLRAAPLERARNLTGDLLGDRQLVLARIALAAVAERAELVEASDALLLDPVRWDDSSTTRYEYRRALGALWAKASEPAREALLAYAEEAQEATETIERLAAHGIDLAPDEARREWRSRLLYRIREDLPAQWLERLGPLDPLEDDRLSEPTAEWVRSPSPVATEVLSILEPGAFLTLLRDWSPVEPRSFADPTLEGLAATASEAVVSRLPEFGSFGDEFSRLRPPLVGAITSAVHRGLREGRIGERDVAIRLVLDIAEALGPGVDAEYWSRQVKRDVAGTIRYGANEGLLGEVESARALAVLGVLLADDDPSPESEERDVASGHDAGMLALNSVRGETMTAMIELFLGSRRTGRTGLAEAISGALRRAIPDDQSRSVRAALGIRLPWLLGRDGAHQPEWLELLFGAAVPRSAREATWEGYLLYSRYFSDIAPLLAAQYGAAVIALEARPPDERSRPRDEDEQLGIHVAMAHLAALPAEAEGRWLGEFYERTADWLRARVTRWIAKQATLDEVGPEVRSRARAFLESRVAKAVPDADPGELKAMTWIARATDHADEVLELIVLAALEKTGGVTENEVGAADLVARQASDKSRVAARVLQLLVAGDPWRSLPHVAAADLRCALQAIIGSQDDEAREIAMDVVHTLGAQGFLEYRDLLGGDDRDR